jgi:hypothetical protein
MSLAAVTEFELGPLAAKGAIDQQHGISRVKSRPFPRGFPRQASLDFSAGAEGRG